MQVFNPREIPDKFPILISQLHNFTTIDECSEACRCHVTNSIIVAKANRKKREKNIHYLPRRIASLADSIFATRAWNSKVNLLVTQTFIRST